VVLNDTVATLLAGLSCQGKECPGQIGFILGTGTNVACVEKGTIRNAESGECDKMARSPCDLAYDATLPDTGAAPFEKMVSGAYLGGVGRELLKAAARAGLIDGAGLDGVSLTALDLDAFGAGDVSSSSPLAAALAPKDIPVARELVRAVFLRAVSLTAAHLAAFVRRSAEAGRSPVRITADGSTYWKTRAVDFDGLVRKEIAELVPDVPFEIVHIDEAPMVGAAVAAMRFNS
jgi:hexokinase